MTFEFGRCGKNGRHTMCHAQVVHHDGLKRFGKGKLRDFVVIGVKDAGGSIDDIVPVRENHEHVMNTVAVDTLWSGFPSGGLGINAKLMRLDMPVRPLKVVVW